MGSSVWQTNRVEKVAKSADKRRYTVTKRAYVTEDSASQIYSWKKKKNLAFMNN